jgi:hypothetical protein
VPAKPDPAAALNAKLLKSEPKLKALPAAKSEPHVDVKPLQHHCAKPDPELVVVIKAESVSELPPPVACPSPGKSAAAAAATRKRLRGDSASSADEVADKATAASAAADIIPSANRPCTDGGNVDVELLPLANGDSLLAVVKEEDRANGAKTNGVASEEVSRVPRGAGD